MGKPPIGSRSLEEIEGTRWGDPPADSTRLVTEAHRLRRKPVAELTVEDLRLLIGQRIGVDVLVPRALTLLQDDPLAEGDLFAGDLLCAVLRLDGSSWLGHPAWADAVEAIASRIVQPPDLVIQELKRWRAARHHR